MFHIDARGFAYLLVVCVCCEYVIQAYILYNILTSLFPSMYTHKCVHCMSVCVVCVTVNDQYPIYIPAVLDNTCLL